MIIVSWQFFIFVLAVLAVYYLLPPRAQLVWLLLASCVFYAWLGWGLILALGFLVGFNFLIGLQLSRPAPCRRLWLWLGIALNIVMLAAFKYFDFFEPQVAAALAGLNIRVDEAALAVLTPVGLSFTVLQTISYLVDVSRGQLSAMPALLDFALYVAYFPKLTSGPIERARTFLPRLANPRVVDNDMLTRSFGLVMLGLFRKVVIADQLKTQIPANLFTQPLLAVRHGPDAILYLVAYGFYLFNDFAGYTAIVRGVSGFFGIELSPNFLTPFFSRDFTEFWNQWHISLSEWLRDYIYFPVTRFFLRRNANPRFVLTLVVPPMVTMLVSGLWHNASLPLLVWGALHGVYLTVERVWSAFRPVRRPGQRPLALQILSGALVFVLVTIAWIPFNVTGLVRGRAYIQAMLQPGALKDSLPVIVFIALGLLLDGLQRVSAQELFFLKWPKPAQAALLTAAGLVLIMMAAQTTPYFVYQNF